MFNGIELDRYSSKTKQAGRLSFLSEGMNQGRALKFLSDLCDFSQMKSSFGSHPTADTKRLQKATEDDSRIEWLGRISEEEKIERLQNLSCSALLHWVANHLGLFFLKQWHQELLVASDIPGYSKLTRGGKDARFSKLATQLLWGKP